MNRNWWIALNIFLGMAAGLLGWQLYDKAQRFEVDNDPARIVPVSDPRREIGGEGELPPSQSLRRLDASEFEVIPSQNLFSATRGVEEEEEAAPSTAEAPVLKNKPVLVGVTISGGERRAIIDDPNTNEGRRTKIMQLGDTFEGYTVVDISTDRMVLGYGSQREVIPLYDPAKHPTPAGKTPIIATRVVGFGGAAGSGASSSRQTTTAPARTTQQAARPTVSSGRQAVTTTSPASSQITPEQSGAQRSVQTIATRQEGIQNQSSTTSTNETIDAEGRRIIHTPFGDIVRPAPKKTP